MCDVCMQVCEARDSTDIRLCSVSSNGVMAIMNWKTVLVASGVLLSACSTRLADDDFLANVDATEPDVEAPPHTKREVVQIAEAFVSVSREEDNIDSPAAWVAPDGKVWLLATAKSADHLVLYDGDTGEVLATHGSSGAGAGNFRRANGIFIIDDFAFVVERDNRRVQVLELPSLRTIGLFGDAQLEQPYGVWIRSAEAGSYEVFVTDAYMDGEDENGDDIIPPLAQLNRRVHRFHVEIGGGVATGRHLGAFGDTTEEGAIRVPESIWGDPEHDRLLIAEEDDRSGTSIREYDLAGRYRGRTIGRDTFEVEVEGITLWSCPDGSGYWIATDQFKGLSVFHVFDRVSLEHIGAFKGAVISNTDGVWLHQASTDRFPRGVLYAVHDDQSVGAFDWQDIAHALRLRVSCAD